MPAPVSYDVFVANVQQEDLNMLTAFTVGLRVRSGSPEEADALFNEAQRLYQAGMLVEVHRVYREEDGVVVQFFDGYATDIAKGYLARLARERVLLSREPIPEPEA